MARAKKDAPTRPRGGSDTLAERGLVALSVALPLAERDLLHAAARLSGRKTSEWLRELAVAEARKILGKSS